MLKRLQNEETEGFRPKSRGPIRLSAGWRWTIYAVAFGLWASGTLWLALHYFMQRQGPFGTAPHPAEFWTLAAHAGFGFAALFVFGAMLERHITRAWPTQRRRGSGLLFVVIAAVLTVTGYLLYYTGGETARLAIALTHWGLGLVTPVFFLRHRFSRG